MKLSLLDHLVCPLDHGRLTLRDGASSNEDGDDVISGMLVCGSCQAEWPVRDGVPRMLPGELAPDVAHTARNFGESWKIWKDIDDDRYRDQFLAWLTPRTGDDFRGRLVLDCGCGKGRHLRVVHQFGARTVIGVDLSAAVDVAYANTRELPGVHVVQGDLFQLPFRPESFDAAYSIGVLHHTPSPDHAFHSMTGMVRRGGTVSAWVYGRENNGWIIWLVNPVRLLITRWLPSGVVRLMSWMLATFLLIGIKLVYVPARAIGLRLFYMDYLLALNSWGFRETAHVVHDHLVAPTAFYLPRDAVDGWTRDEQLDDVTVSWVRRMSWSICGRRPGSGATTADTRDEGGADEPAD